MGRPVCWKAKGSGQPLAGHSDQPVEWRILRSWSAQKRILKQTRSRALHTLFLVGLLAHQTCRATVIPDWVTVLSLKGVSFSLGECRGAQPGAPHIRPASDRLCSVRVGGTGACVLAVVEGVRTGGEGLGCGDGRG